VGSCATTPCDVFAPIGCYVCHRFEAFAEGPHDIILADLEDKKKNRLEMGLGPDSIRRDDYLIDAINTVIEKANDILKKNH